MRLGKRVRLRVLSPNVAGFLNPFSSETFFKRQNLTSVDIYGN